jgi:hypothetical protein
MILLDEHVPPGQRHRLRGWRVSVRQFEYPKHPAGAAPLRASDAKDIPLRPFVMEERGRTRQVTQRGESGTIGFLLGHLWVEG